MIKGAHNGICNRTACTAERHVVYFNRMTQKYYCPKCARAINEFAKRPICEAQTENGKAADPNVYPQMGC